MEVELIRLVKHFHRYAFIRCGESRVDGNHRPRLVDARKEFGAVAMGCKFKHSEEQIIYFTFVCDIFFVGFYKQILKNLVKIIVKRQVAFIVAFNHLHPT